MGKIRGEIMKKKWILATAVAGGVLAAREAMKRKKKEKKAFWKSLKKGRKR